MVQWYWQLIREVGWSQTTMLLLRWIKTPTITWGKCSTLRHRILLLRNKSLNKKRNKSKQKIRFLAGNSCCASLTRMLFWSKNPVPGLIKGYHSRLKTQCKKRKTPFWWHWKNRFWKGIWTQLKIESSISLLILECSYLRERILSKSTMRSWR